MTSNKRCKDHRLNKFPRQKVNWALATIVTCILLVSNGISLASADDSSSSPQLDMGALANIASNLGNNPQIMNMVSSLFNQKPSGSSASSSPSSSQQDFGITDQESNSIGQASSATSSGQPTSGGNEPLKRGNNKPTMEMSTVKKESGAAAASSSSAPAAATSSSAAANPLSGLMSMLPGLNLGNLNLSGLGGLLSKITSAQGSAQTVTATSDNNPNAASSITATSSSGPEPVGTVATSTPGAPSTTQNGTSSAQTVINQVIAAYANGQIPTELIQMSLSGRVPPQMIELALSGQVPPQLIQMIITGQVPMSTINAFLSAMQNSNGSGGAAAASAASKSTGPEPSASASVAASPTSKPIFTSGTLQSHASITKSLLEALFKPHNTSIKVPTLLGPVPVQVPIPNVRRIGQLMGGAVTNMASMIPF